MALGGEQLLMFALEWFQIDTSVAATQFIYLIPVI
jgi:hypothetical protein